jgi:hypothetical protein
MKQKATSLNPFNQSWFKDRRQETIIYSQCSLKFRINVLKPTDISKMRNTRKIMFQVISTRMEQYQAKTVCKQWLLERCFICIYRCTWRPYHMPYMDRRGVLEKGCRFNNPRSAGCARADIRLRPSLFGALITHSTRLSLGQIGRESYFTGQIAFQTKTAYAAWADVAIMYQDQRPFLLLMYAVRCLMYNSS